MQISSLTSSPRLQPIVGDVEKNHRILVVDDNEAIHADFRKILCEDTAHQAFEAEESEIFGSIPTQNARAHFEIDFAFQGEEALERVRAAVAVGRRYAMVFMDVRMPPGWDGLQTTQKVWEVDPDLQIVICTAYSDYSWEKMMVMIGSPERMLILKKPFDTIEVLQIAHSLTEKWSLLQASRANTAVLERAVDDRTYELQGMNALLEAEIAVRKQAAESAREGEQEQRQLASQLRVERSQLAKSEAALALAQGVAHLGSWELDLLDLKNLDRNPLRWSDETYRIFGRTPDQTPVSNAAFFEIVHPADREKITAGIGDLLRTGQPYSVDHRIILASGQERVVHEEARLIYAGNPNRPTKIAGTVQDITERKRAEEALNESEQRFRFLSELGDATRALSHPTEIMAAVSRLLGTHLNVSRCAYAEMEKDGNHFTIPDEYIDGCVSILGQHRLSDFGGHTHSELTAGRMVVLRDIDAELPDADGVDAYNAAGIKAMIACPLIKDGKLIAAMAVHHLAPRHWSEGEVALVQEVVERCWSIVERARTELVLRASEEHLRLVLAASNDGIFEHDFITGVIIWSDRIYEMFGLDPRSFVPSIEGFTALIHPDDRADFREAVAGQMAHGGRYDAHTRIRRRDGSYGNFLGRGEVVLDAAGKPTRIVGSLSDLTSLLQAEQKLMEQGNLLNLAQDAIMVRDMDDRFEFWNHGAEALYGWSAEEVRGHPNDDFLEYDKAVKILAERTLLESGAWSGECRHLTKNGESVIVRSRWTLVRDEHGQPKSKLIIATDMTEQKKIEEQFLRAQRLESIGTLASGVAHDLNNILVPIMMAAPVLRGEMEPADREKFLDIVETSAHRGADIIKQVLTFARGADGDRILLQPIYLLEEVSKIVSQTFPKSITLRTCYDDNIRSLEADSTQLHQVLLNLCINARDAMPNGGELCLGAENFDVDEAYARMTPGATAGPHVMVQITDTGSGIAKEVIEKIFDPFFTTKNIGKGTGLGLSTVAGIVKSHGGFIRVDSQPGCTSFKIVLPAKAISDVSDVLQADTMVPRGDGETILLVDDEPSIREVAQLILKAHGYKVIVAEDGPAALALLARQMGSIAVVVTDLAMPGMDGLMLVRTLRQIDPRVKIILSTGGADESLGSEVVALHLDGCLTKPYTKRDLLLKISNVLHSDLQTAA